MSKAPDWQLKAADCQTLELNAAVTVLCIASVPFTFKLSLISLALPHVETARLSGLEWLVIHPAGLHAHRRLPMIQVLTGPDVEKLR